MIKLKRWQGPAKEDAAFPFSLAISDLRVRIASPCCGMFLTICGSEKLAAHELIDVGSYPQYCVGCRRPVAMKLPLEAIYSSWLKLDVVLDEWLNASVGPLSAVLVKDHLVDALMAKKVRGLSLELPKSATHRIVERF